MKHKHATKLVNKLTIVPNKSPKAKKRGKHFLFTSLSLRSIKFSWNPVETLVSTTFWHQYEGVSSRQQGKQENWKLQNLCCVSSCSVHFSRARAGSFSRTRSNALPVEEITSWKTCHSRRFFSRSRRSSWKKQTNKCNVKRHSKKLR